MLTLMTQVARAESFQQRRQHLLEMLSDPSIFPVRHKHFTADIHSRKWQFYHASLAQGIRIDEANKFFETLEVRNDEWLTLMMLNTYCEFKELLTSAAKDRMNEIIFAFAKGLERRNLNAVTIDNNENHLVNWKVIFLLTDQEFGMDMPKKREQAYQSLKKWVQFRIQQGMEEFNSPHYMSRSLHALFLIYDYYDDPTLKKWAQIGIDAILGNYALLSLNNVRGGPYFRTIFTDEFLEEAPRDENRNGLDDHLYEVGYLYFGNCALPSYQMNDCHFLLPCIVTTKYRLPEVLYDLATNKGARGQYVVKERRRDRFDKVYNLYYYITPAYSLGSMQNRVELDNYHGGDAKPFDHWNNQVWELSFADPRKILGPKRYLLSMSVEQANPNTANMQYRNVLFYKGQFLDYNDNLAGAGNTFLKNTSGDKTLYFWNVLTDDGGVFVAATDFPTANAGILEIGLEADYASFEAFQAAIRDSESHCHDTGMKTHYVSTTGDVIDFDHGKAKVNGKPFALDNYATLESPFARSPWGKGIMEFSINGKSLRLDARKLHQPVRMEKNSTE